MYQMETEKIRRRNQFRTITVAAFPAGERAAFGSARAGARPARSSSRPPCRPGYTTARSAERTRSRSKASRAERRDGRLGDGDLPRAGVPVQERGEAAGGLLGDSVRHRRRAGDSPRHGRALRIHGLSGDREPDRRHRQPRDRAVRLHRGDARRRASLCATRCSTPGSCGCDP